MVTTPLLPGMLEFLCLTPAVPGRASPAQCLPQTLLLALCASCLVNNSWQEDNVSGIYLKRGGLTVRVFITPQQSQRPGFVKTSSSRAEGLAQGWEELVGVTLPVPPDNPVAFSLPPVRRVKKSFLTSLPGGL